MADACNWILFYAHPARFTDEKDQQPDFYGVFAVPLDRREPEVLLEEVLSNRKLFLTRVLENRRMKLADGWGLHEKLKGQLAQQGYGLSLTKVQYGGLPRD